MDAAAVAHDFAQCLAVGAHESGTLEVRRLELSRAHREHWEARRYTLSQQVPVGAFAHVLQTSGRRVLWTTTSGSVQRGTLWRWAPRGPIEIIRGEGESDLEALEDLRAKLERSVLEALVEASPDGRTRRCTVRGFDGEAAVADWERRVRFERISAGAVEELTAAEVHWYLDWHEDRVPREEARRLGGLPVPERILDAVTRLEPDLVDYFGLIPEGAEPRPRSESLELGVRDGTEAGS
jgi:hypothetical protein